MTALTRSLTATAVLLTAMLASPSAGHTQTFKVERWNIGGEGGHDYIVAEAGTGRVFVSRGTHVMVIDGKNGTVLGDIPTTIGRNHGVGIAGKENHGFITVGGDSSVVMFDLTTLAVLKTTPIKVGGLDGIMYDDASNQIILTNHSKVGTAVTMNAKTGEVTGTAELEDNLPEGAVTDGKGRMYVNNKGKNTIQVVDVKSMKVLASWPLAPCEGPTGLMMDRKSMRLFAGCGKTSVVVDANSGKVVANITNGDGVDALAYDDSQKLIYIPAGQSGTVTVVREDGPDKYSVVATVQTMKGAKTIAVDPVTHRAYAVAIERGPSPAPAAGVAAPPAGGRAARPAPGPIVGVWFIAISH